MNVVLIGYGYWGPNVARNIFESSLTNLYAICDNKQERLDLAKTKYLAQTQYYLNYSELINDDHVQAIAIAVETESHFKIAKEAICAGKHVFIEKPMTSTSAEALELQKLARQHKVKIHVDHIMIFHPAINKVKALIDSGEMGDLLYFDSSRMNLGKIKNDVSAMWDLAVHDIAVIDYLIGGLYPEEITAMGLRQWSKKQSLTFLNLKYDKFIAHLKSSWISPVKERRMIIAGENKMIVFDDMLNTDKVIIYDKGFELDNKYENIEYNEYVIKVREGDALIPHIPFEDALRNSIEHFVNAIQNNTDSISNSDQAIRIIEILEAADKQLASHNN
jgi:predicted dehydrogenase